ncbi:hypothetical protein NP233_g11375 [Leucocoprinus birnbaumii]|uniref:BTB domain-containing protein n=1 Tax=Leucocoprinus birnbaumii TaxID=56174 RepID=A0AAD5VGP1_9AGAR|nr:hypothetical protein NP233_g11375 [Leucocoprinus birnbaumii]
MSAPTTPQHTATQAPETPAQAAPGFAVPNVNDPSKKPTPPRDWVYFRETGDCLLCVGGVLFKVHRYLLTKESPVFQKKLAAADGAKAAKGQPNADTIILDDDVDLFRDLCWVLYASLDELWQLTSAPISGSPLSRMKKLLRIAEISHKYEITGTRTWAVHGVADLYEKYEQAEMKKPDADLSFIFAEPTTDLLKCFTIAAEISQRKDMFERAKQIWLSDIEKGRAIAHEALAMVQLPPSHPFRALWR